MTKIFIKNILFSIFVLSSFLFSSSNIFAQSSTPNSSIPTTNGSVFAIAQDPTCTSNCTTYIGGSFTTVGGQTRRRLAAIDSSGNVTSWNPNVTDATSQVNAIAVSGSTIYVGGTFTTGGGNIGGQPRNRIAAVNNTTGTATTWNPNADGAVKAVVVDSSTIYIGGDFVNVGITPRVALAALDATTGTATSWDAGLNNGPSTVNGIIINGSTVYIGGSFTTAGGQSRNRIAALDKTTAAASSWNPNSNNIVNSMALNGTILYVGGSFTTIGGASRSQIAALDTTINTNNATAWDPNVTAGSNVPFAISTSNTTVYTGGGFTAIGGQSRNRIASLKPNVNTNNATIWNPNADNLVNAVLVNSSSVYIGGQFTTIGGSSRQGFAQFDFPTVTLSASPTTISEAGGVSTVTATLSGANSVDSTIGLTFGGTATLTTNYTRSATSITITAGSTTGAITITGVNDGVFNPSLTVIPTISTATNTIIGSPSSATVTITNVNSTPTVTLTASPTSIASVSGTSTLTATLNAVSGVNTVANLTYTGSAVRNTNYSAPNSITITAGSLTGTGTITRLTSPTVGPDLSIISTITSVDNNYATIGNPSSATVNLTNTTPSLSINNVTASEDAGTMTFTVTLSSSSSGTVTVDYATANGTATAGVNYVATSGTLTFTSGITTQTVPITLIDSQFGEGTTKTFTVNLSNPSGATISSATGTGTIQGVNPSGPPVNIEVVGGNNVTVGADGAILTLIGSTTLTSPLYNWEIISGGVGFLTNANEQTAYYHIPPYPPTTTVTIRLTVTGTSASIGAKLNAEAPLFQTTSDSSTTEINISGTGPVGGGGCNISQTTNSFSIFYLLLSLLVVVSLFRIKWSFFSS